MADYWTAPKTNWVVNDGIGYEDLNRMEANISANRDANLKMITGFGYIVQNDVPSQDGVLVIYEGYGYSENGVPFKMGSAIQKNLTTWAPGSGPSIGGMASGVTVTAHQWYYIFAIIDPTDGSVEIMFDDDPSGANISSGIYTEKRYVNSFKTGVAGTEGSFLLGEMYSQGNRVYMYPNNMYPSTSGGIVHPEPLNDNYDTLLLRNISHGYALPEREVIAKLNLIIDAGDLGLMAVDSGFAGPSELYSSYPGIPQGEFVALVPGESPGSGGKYSVETDIYVPTSRNIKIAVYLGLDTVVRVRGYYDPRLLESPPPAPPP